MSCNSVLKGTTIIHRRLYVVFTDKMDGVACFAFFQVMIIQKHFKMMSLFRHDYPCAPA